MNYDMDDLEMRHRTRAPRPRGCDPRDGYCGAPDCPACHPEWQRTCSWCGWRGYLEDGEACPGCGEEAGE